MCGIIGYIGDDAPQLEGRLRVARDEMIHRGPDDAGLWQAGGACLGARRLAILDLSPAGHMPMHTVDARYSIVFNGAIYNHVELRNELTRTVAFRSTGDTEVLLHGFREWGWRTLLDRIDGMFAFAIWDGEKRQLFAARDRAGEKPFFHARIGAGFAFASTLAALVRLRGGATTVDPRALDAYLTYQAVPAPLSIFEGFAQLSPAHALHFDASSGHLDIQRYWDLRYAPKRRISEREALDEIDVLTRKSVRQRLRSDVPTGTLLSGGVDSSLVTAMASQETGVGIDAVTMGYDGGDERPFARIVAARYGVRLHEDVLAPSAVNDLPAIVAQYGQPLADVSIVPNYHLAAAARRYMTVALVGDGADEVFGGYARPIIERAAGVYRRLPGSLRHKAVELFRQQHGERSASRLRRVMSQLASSGAGSARDAYVYDRAFRSLRDVMYTPALLSAVGRHHPDALYAAVWDRAPAETDVDRALYGDFAAYLPDQLLAKADVSAMAHGLETRSPFLAREIIEFAATLPTSLRLKGFTTKYLLKRVAERYLPREVIHRRKQGFVIPSSRWLRGELAPHLNAVLDNPRFLDRGWIRPDAVRSMLREHASGRHDWGEQLWTLLVLEVWARLTLDGSLLPSDSLEAVLEGSRRPLHALQIGMGWFTEQPGGLNRVYANLLPALGAHDVECRGLVVGGAQVEASSNGLARAFAEPGESRWSRFRGLRAAALPWLREHGDESVVVSHFAQHAFPLLDYVGTRPFVVHFQGPWAEESRLEGASAATAALRGFVERRVYRRATAVIVLSRAFGNILSTRYGVDASRIHVIPGGVDASRFAIRMTPMEARAELGWPADRRIVLCVRRLVNRVGLPALIDACVLVRERVPDALVLIAGRGPLRAELETRIASLGIGDHVRLLGFVPDDVLSAAYRAADLTVVPSQALEGFGLITVESLAAGTPCVVTPVGGLSEIMEGFAPQLVTASPSAVDIASTLSAALLGELALPSAEACAVFARDNYDWPAIAARVKRVYEQAVR